MAISSIPLFSQMWPGVDPKSLVCEYFRAGQCTKGFKCKFSHDLNVERKTQKIDLFSDKCALPPPMAFAPSVSDTRQCRYGDQCRMHIPDNDSTPGYRRLRGQCTCQADTLVSSELEKHCMRNLAYSSSRSSCKHA